MDFEIPADLAAYLAELDEFIELQIRPLERHGDNVRFFDHRREDARTDWDRGGLPSREWEALLAGDEAGWAATQLAPKHPVWRCFLGSLARRVTGRQAVYYEVLPDEGAEEPAPASPTPVPLKVSVRGRR